MVALLRYIYGLPYYEGFGDQRGQLQPHAEAYVVAEKYQVQGLKFVISTNLRHMIHLRETFARRVLRKRTTSAPNSWTPSESSSTVHPLMTTITAGK